MCTAVNMDEAVSSVTWDMIIHRFDTFKINYIDAMDENKSLKETIELMSASLQSKENQRLKLFNVIRERTDKYQKRVRCLQERNGQLESIIHDQKQSLHEFSKKMIALENTATVQSKEIENYLNTIDNLKEEVASLKSKLKSSTNNNINIMNASNLQLSKKRKAAGLTLLAHPSFCQDFNEKLQMPKKRRLSNNRNRAHHRYPNLNITFSAGEARGKDVSSSNSSSISENDVSYSREKRRKLYAPDDDATIDLSHEKD